ncbi:hypothetical protein DF186_16100, partial [Enterococcus hirae]
GQGGVIGLQQPRPDLHFETPAEVHRFRNRVLPGGFGPQQNDVAATNGEGVLGRGQRGSQGQYEGAHTRSDCESAIDEAGRPVVPGCVIAHA